MEKKTNCLSKSKVTPIININIGKTEIRRFFNLRSNSILKVYNMHHNIDLTD